MRTRTRTTNANLPAGSRYFYERNTANPANPWQGPYTVSSNVTTSIPSFLTETMIDELPKLQRSGTCRHSKVSTWVLDAGSPGAYLPIKESAPGQLEYRYYFSGGHLVSLFAPTFAALLAANATVRSYKWGEWSYDAIQKMRPSLSDGLLLPASIAELRETGRTLLASYQKRSGKYPSPASGLIDRTSQWMRRAAASIAGLNLWWQFFVRPTLSDARALADLIVSFRSRLSELIRQAGKVRTAHYARRADILDLAADTTLTSVVDALWTRTTRRKADWTSRPAYHASMVYTLDATRLQSKFGELEAILHTLGVTKPLSVIWELVPFSFVVDWFVSIGEWISSLEDELFHPLPIVIHDFSHSVKWSYRNQIELDMVAKYGTGRLTTPIAAVEHSFYERRRESPTTWDALSVRTPSLNQVGLGLSLIVVRMDGIPQSRKG